MYARRSNSTSSGLEAVTGVLGNLSVAQSSLQSGLASQQSSLNTSLASVLGQLARYCTVLYCTVLYCTVLYCVLYCTG